MITRWTDDELDRWNDAQRARQQDEPTIAMPTTRVGAQPCRCRHSVTAHTGYLARQQSDSVCLRCDCQWFTPVLTRREQTAEIAWIIAGLLAVAAFMFLPFWMATR